MLFKAKMKQKEVIEVCSAKSNGEKMVKMGRSKKSSSYIVN